MILSLACLLLGILAAWKLGSPNALVVDIVIRISLGAIILCAGIDIGAKRSVLKKLSTYGSKVFLVPLAVAAGSILGGLIAAPFLGMSYNEGAALAAGFGYYSLSSGILAGLGGAELGSLAFVTNIMREVFALAFIPLLAKLHYFCAIAAGGATSMDTTLGMISHSTDEETTLISMLNGVVLSILVPILVPLLYGSVR